MRAWMPPGAWLLSAVETDAVVNRAVTGRPARSLYNRLVDTIVTGQRQGTPPLAHPHQAVADLVAAGRARQDPDLLYLAAGQGVRARRPTQGTAEIVRPVGRGDGGGHWRVVPRPCAIMRRCAPGRFVRSNRVAREKGHMRAHIIIPDELVAEVDALVGPRKRSQFFAEAAADRLRRERLMAAAAAAAGSLVDVDIPGWETPESTYEWVRARRRASTARLERAWGTYPPDEDANS